MSNHVFTTSELKVLTPEIFPPPVFQKMMSKPKEGSTQITYFIAPLLVKYEDIKTGEKIKCKKFLLEGPVVESTNGIYAKFDNGQWSASIQCPLPLSNNDLDPFAGPYVEYKTWDSMPDVTRTVDGREIKGKDSVGIMQQITWACFKAAFQSRQDLGLGNIRNAEGFESIFKPLIKFEMNSNTGQVREGSSPSMYLNLKLFGDPKTCATYSKASFYMPISKAYLHRFAPNSSEYKEIENHGQISVSWDKLTNCYIKFKPLIEFERMTVAAGKVSIRARVVSAVVLDMKKSTTLNRQQATLDAARNDESLVDNLTKQYLLRAQQIEAENLEKSECDAKLSNVATEELPEKVPEKQTDKLVSTARTSTTTTAVSSRVDDAVDALL